MYSYFAGLQGGTINKRKRIMEKDNKQPPASTAAPPSYEEVMEGSISESANMYPKAAPPVAGTHAAAYAGVQQPTAPGVYPAQQPHYTYGAFESTPVSVVVQPATTVHVVPDIIVINGCPACRIGVLEESYPCLGLLCALVFFPIGIICCLAMRVKRCTNCGMEF